MTDLMRAVDAARRTALMPDLVPVIFANGVDDDLLGLEAAVHNERVLYGDHVYEVDEPLEIVALPDTAGTPAGITLCLSPLRILVLGHGSDVSAARARHPDTYIIQEGPTTRHLLIEHCLILMGAPPRW